MEKLKPIIVVADDGGLHETINEGTRVAAERRAISCVDYMVEERGAIIEALSLHNEFPHVSIGLHVSIPGINDYAVTALSYSCRWRPLDKLYKEQLIRHTEKQIKIFQDAFGYQPAHLSTQGNLHLDYGGNSFIWFLELMERLSGSEVSTILVRGIDTIPIRHTRFREMILGRNPLTPEQFRLMLHNMSPSVDRPLELVVHPAQRLNWPTEPPLKAFYITTLRECDLNSLLEILNEGVIEKAGYEIVPPEVLLSRQITK